MIATCRGVPYGVRATGHLLLLCVVSALSFYAERRVAADTATAVPVVPLAPAHPEQHASRVNSRTRSTGRTGGDDVPVSDLRFTHLTTTDGLSQGYVTAIVQDRLGFMWFATRDGLNRYDGGAFVVYKNNPADPASLSSSFLQDLLEDDQGHLWIATNVGVNRFDPETERCTRYLHDPGNPATLGGASVKSIAKDPSGVLWFGTEDAGLDRLDPKTGRFTHYRSDTGGQFVGRITQVIAGRAGTIWFVGERGLFRLDARSGSPSPSSVGGDTRSATSVYEDEDGVLWMLVDAPAVALVTYDPQSGKRDTYPLGGRAGRALASTTNGGSANGSLAADGERGFWVPSSQGLYYFDRRTARYTYRFEHDDTNPESLDSNAVMSIYRDRGGVLWVGTENAGLNLLNFAQQQFGLYRHRPADPRSVSAGRVKAIFQDPDGTLWAGLFPRALDRIDLKTGDVTHYRPGRGRTTLGEGTNVSAIYRDGAGVLWIGGGGSGLARLDERTGRFTHFVHRADDPASLLSNNVYTIFGDRRGGMWVGQEGGISRFNPATQSFVSYRPLPDQPASLSNTVWIMYQDRAGTLWAGTWGGTLLRFDEPSNTFVTYAPDPTDPRRLNGGGINTLYEDRSGMLWVGTFDGLYQYDRTTGAFLRFTEQQGLPSSSIRCILGDDQGKLWLSTQRGLSRFDPGTRSFRNYDVTDGLQSNEFSTGCAQGADGTMFFGGSNGLNAFRPQDIHDSPYVPPVAITGFRIFNRPVPIRANSMLDKAIPYVDSLTLPYRDNVFSFEFAALSFANAGKNRYRYRLDPFDASWNEAGSTQRVSTYTNLGPGQYVFRVQGSNSDGVWNDAGVSLPILILPPWWMTAWFRGLCVCLAVAVLWGAHRFRIRQIQHAFEMTLDARVGERTRIARELHDTLLQGFHGLLLRFQTVSHLLPTRPVEAKDTLDRAIAQAATALTEGRDAVQGLRTSTVEQNDLAAAIRALGDELATDAGTHSLPALSVAVEGHPRDVHPILRDEIYKIAAEALRNAYRHAAARHVEVELHYANEHFHLRVRDDGRGIDPAVLARHGVEGHYGLRGMPERAALIGGTVTVWSQAGEGTEVELSLPGGTVYASARRRSWVSRTFASRRPA